MKMLNMSAIWSKRLQRLVSKHIYFWVEKYLFNPSLFQKFLSFLLLPLSFLYCFIMIIRRASAREKKYEIPIISIGNLIVGGSGKTPVTIALAKEYEDVFIILRGYKRHSKGLIQISQKGDILASIKESGDEAMLYAMSLPNASVIVAEDRDLAIEKAIRLGAKLIFLDDGFSKVKIHKLDILLRAEATEQNPFCLPAGPFREPSYLYNSYITLRENHDFRRHVQIKNPTEKMILVTAISKPQRLDSYLPKDIQKITFPDHYAFKKEQLHQLISQYNATSILTTQKDAVKMQSMDLPLSIMDLEITFKEDIFQHIDTFIEDFAKISKKQN